MNQAKPTVSLSTVGALAPLMMWPAWGSRHSAFVVHRNAGNGMVLLVPITHSTMGRRRIQFNNAALSEAHKPTGPLDRTGVSFAVILDDCGFLAPQYFEPKADHYVLPGFGDVQTNPLIDLNGNRSWQTVHGLILKSLRDVRDR